MDELIRESLIRSVKLSAVCLLLYGLKCALLGDRGYLHVRGVLGFVSGALGLALSAEFIYILSAAFILSVIIGTVKRSRK